MTANPNIGVVSGKVRETSERLRVISRYRRKNRVVNLVRQKKNNNEIYVR